MMSPSCSDIRRDLGPYMDGALAGARRLQVAQHLNTCAACADEEAAFGRVGDVLRELAQETPAPSELAGLASNVITRTRAESAESWRGLFDRAVSDWHWTIVGTGSVAATFVSTLAVSALLVFGTKPMDADSLSSRLSPASGSAGVLYMYATPLDGREPVLLQVGDGNPPASSQTAALATGGDYEQPTEAELADALTSVVTREGRLVPLDALHPRERRYAEDLLDQIGRRRLAEPLPLGSSIQVNEFRLVTTTNVVAKGL